MLDLPTILGTWEVKEEKPSVVCTPSRPVPSASPCHPSQHSHTSHNCTLRPLPEWWPWNSILVPEHVSTLCLENPTEAWHLTKASPFSWRQWVFLPCSHRGILDIHFIHCQVDDCLLAMYAAQHPVQIPGHKKSLVRLRETKTSDANPIDLDKSSQVPEHPSINNSLRCSFLLFIPRVLMRNTSFKCLINRQLLKRHFRSALLLSLTKKWSWERYK